MPQEYTVDPEYNEIDASRIIGMIENAPFTFNAGKITQDGKLLNNIPPVLKYSGSYALTANTANQVVKNNANPYYTKMFFIINQSVTKTSYDWRINFLVQKALQIRMYDTLGGNIQWFQDTITDTTARGYYGDVPCGDNIDIQLQCDNNHATDVITVSWRMWLMKPSIP